MGGSENLTISIIRNDKVFQHIIVVLDGHSDFQKYCEEKYKIFFINLNLKSNSFLSLQNWKTVFITMKKIQPDLIQSYMYDASRYSRLLGLALNIPVLVYVVNTYSYKKIRRGFFNFILSFLTHKVIVNSEEVSREVGIIDRVPFNKIVLLESFSSIDFKKNNNLQLRRKLNIKKNDYLFLFIARLVEQKGIDYLIDAFNICVNKNKIKELKLVVVGDGELLTHFLEKIINYKLTEHIYFVGEDPELNPYLTEADAYIDSSIRSGLSVAAIKALDANLPMIMTDVGGVQKLSSNGKYVKICPPADSYALSIAIMNYFRSKTYTNIGAHQFARSRFSDILATKNIVALYKEALKV
jgi:glycosyltransferase involved in cell wall biosynthesis